METFPQIHQTSNSFKKGKDIDFEEIIKSHSSKENNSENNNVTNTNVNNDHVEASSPVRNILENFKSQLELVKEEKHEFYQKQKCSEYKGKAKKLYGHQR